MLNLATAFYLICSAVTLRPTLCQICMLSVIFEANWVRKPGKLEIYTIKCCSAPPHLKFPKMPLKSNYVTASSFIPPRHLPFLEIFSWSSVCFVTQSFESGEHSTAPKAPDGWREVYIASWPKYTSSLTPAIRHRRWCYDLFLTQHLVEHLICVNGLKRLF